MSSNDNRSSLPMKLLTAGTAACIADLTTFPLDTAKVRLQIQGETNINLPVKNKGHQVLIQPSVNKYKGLMGTILTIIRNEGPRSLYNGLAAGLQRQMCFASVRLGLYDSVKEFYQHMFYGKALREGLKIESRIAAGITTGALAVVIAQPTDVVKVRFQAQQNNNCANRYKSTIDAYRKIKTEEGLKGLWKGSYPNMSRNAIVNVSEIVCYDIIKENIITYNLMTDNVPCHFTSAVIAGFCTTVIASPVDVVKTRYMNSKTGSYKGAIDCAAKMLMNEGPRAFYKGFTPSFCRLVTWNIVLWLTYEQMKKAYVMFQNKKCKQEY